MSCNEWGIILAAVGVVIGVLLEGWEHWDEFKKKGWKPLIPKIGFAILVISLAIEIVFDARLAKESADTQLAAAKIEKALAWRHLTKAQREIMHDVLARQREGAAIVSTLLDPEAEEYARDFVDVQKGAQWVTTFDNEWTRHEPGLFLTTVGGGDSPSTTLVRDALQAAKIPYKEIPVFSDDHTIPGGFQKGVTYLMVGRKPRD